MQRRADSVQPRIHEYRRRDAHCGIGFQVIENKQPFRAVRCAFYLALLRLRPAAPKSSPIPDAVPNIWTGKSDAETVILGIVAAARHYGHFPTNDEISMLRASDMSIPAPKTIQANLGGRAERVDAVKAYISDKAEFADVLAMLPSETSVRPVPMAGAKAIDGHVYLIKSGDFYKIGRSDELERRVREIRIA